MAEYHIQHKMRIALLNQQNLIRIKTAQLKRLMEFFISEASSKAGHFAYNMLAILLVNDEGIRRYKIEFFDKNETTDVITIPQAHTLPLAMQSADIIVNTEMALRESKKRTIPLAEEFALYLAHAIDHLSGAKDNTPKKRMAMLKRESLWVASAKSRGLLNDLCNYKG